MALHIYWAVRMPYHMSGVWSMRLNVEQERKRLVSSLVSIMLLIVSVLGVVPAYAVDNATLNAQSEIRLQSDIPYRSPWVPNQTQKMDLYGLSGWSSSESRPVVVFIHGGSWVHGNKSLNDRMPLVNVFLQKGYYVASIDYRLTTEAPWPAQINDSKSAIRFLRDNAASYGIDANRIFVFGESAGAHLALMLDVTNNSNQFVDEADGNGSVSSAVSAVISDYGISDVGEWGSRSGDAVSDATYAKSLLLGDGYTQEQAKQASPLTYVTDKAAPVFIVHGKNDQVVSYWQSIQMEQALKHVGAKNVSSWYPENGPHSSFDVFVQNSDAQRRYLDFFDSVSTGGVASSPARVSVYRLYNEEKRVHLYTNDRNESLILGHGREAWRNEGNAFQVFAGVRNDSQRVTRLHNRENGDYLYTTDPNEVSSLVMRQWSIEGYWYAPTDSDIPVYRLYNSHLGSHILVTEKSELDNLTNTGWKYEGIAFHAFSVEH